MSDEFEGKELDRSKWVVGMEWWKGRQPALFSEKNVTVSDGKLHLTMRKEKLPPEAEKQGYHDYTSAALHTKARTAYGYFEVKAKPMNSGGSSSFWFQQDDKPGWGTEIDVFEIGGKAKGFENKYNMTLHVFQTPTEKKHWSVGGVWIAPWRLADDYHVYGLDWNKDELKFYVDGVVVRHGRKHPLAPAAFPDLRQRDDGRLVRDAQGRGFALHVQRGICAGVEEAERKRMMWFVELPHWWHFVIRAVVVYGFLLVLLRLTGKRQVGQMAPFDLVLLLVLSNAVQNSMNGGDNSISGGLISASTLVGLNWLVGWATFRSKRLEALIEGRPVVLIHDGKIDHPILSSVQMTIHELRAALRAEGFAGEDEARFAILENNGHVTVIPMGEKSDAQS